MRPNDLYHRSVEVVKCGEISAGDRRSTTACVAKSPGTKEGLPRTGIAPRTTLDSRTLAPSSPPHRSVTRQAGEATPEEQNRPGFRDELLLNLARLHRQGPPGYKDRVFAD